MHACEDQKPKSTLEILSFLFKHENKCFLFVFKTGLKE